MNSVAQNFQQVTPAGYPHMPGYQVNSQQPLGGQMARMEPGQQTLRETDFSQIEAAYWGTSADAVDQGRLTYDDIIMKTSILFGILVLITAGAWNVVTQNPSLGIVFSLVGGLGSFVLALVNSFKTKVSPVAVMAYAVCEGLFLGAFSQVMDAHYPGVVAQAVVATIAVFAVMLVLFKSGKVRYTSKMAQILLIGTGGIMLYYLLNLGLQLTGVLSNPWGLSGLTVMGIPLGVVVGLLAIGLGAFSLVGDFHIAQYGVENGAPAVFAWKVAFGFMVTVVWLYVEILRLLAILRSDD
ncbi:hypothetical protein HMPREF0044_0616 [Gleimia coleocanis DSM 15436]|uniref:Bax inhibitor 1 like protein n=2 Tax=Gleimia TaxID=2692113 RepID=C0VZM6_9ACTO|nr:hypothetical protein HMPREF0044_0616 [Gleimia coleocanis DSM 15436]